MISILMATWNGEKYIAEQIDSLLNQTIHDFKLYISDDRSNDRTLAILQDYQRRYADQIFITRRKKNSGGAKHNFFHLMTAHKDDYVMLCDQDDLWLPDKIELTLNKIREMEHQFGKDTPLLAHSDLIIADKALNVLHPSYKETMNANFNRTSLKDALIQNTFAGCSAIYNRALSQLIRREPSYSVMHDWWLMLIASAFGTIGHIDRKTILYRQHSNNSCGAQDRRSLKFMFHKLLDLKNVKDSLSRTYLQAQSFLDMYRAQLTQDQIRLLMNYCEIPRLHKLQRIQRLFQLGTLKNGTARKIAQILCV